MNTTRSSSSSLLQRARLSLRELWGELCGHEFLIREQPLPIREDLHRMSTVSFAAIEETSLANLDVLNVFRLMVQREMAAIERAQALEARPTGDTRSMEKFLKQLLPLLDGFDRILEVARSAPPSEEVTNWLQSIEGLYFRTLKILERQGLTPLKTIGSVVNLDIHEVVEYRLSPDHPADTVISERQKGYIFNGRLLREAQVVVARSGRS